MRRADSRTGAVPAGRRSGAANAVEPGSRRCRGCRARATRAEPSHLLLPRQRVSARSKRPPPGNPPSATRRPPTTVVHFATHAIVRDDDPFSSFLAVGRSGEDDAAADAGEIYGLRLDADLVVLSACPPARPRHRRRRRGVRARVHLCRHATSSQASGTSPTNPPMAAAGVLSCRGSAAQSKARALRSAQLRTAGRPARRLVVCC